MQDKDKDTKYLQLPQSLLRELFYNRKTVMKNMLHVGTYRFAQKLPYDKLDVCRPVLYDYCRHPEKLPNELRKQVKRFIDLGFIATVDDVNFDQELIDSEAASMVDQFTKYAPELLPLVYDYSRVHKAMNFFDIPGNTGLITEQGKRIADAALPGEPWPMISKNLAFEFRDNDKSEYDIAQLACYLAIRSILGKRSYYKTYKPMILARMFGYATFKQLHEANLKPEIKSLVDKYSSRYWMEKLLMEMRISWRLHVYSGTPKIKFYGIYIGVADKISLESLIIAAHERRKKTKAQAIRRQMNEITAKILQTT
jgi:hypothetical protein